MSNTQNTMRLLAWLSPVFPTGGFAYSSGLEAAQHAGLVTDQTSLSAWIEDQIELGSLRNDCIFLLEAWRNSHAEQSNDDIACLAEALAGSSERHLEITAQGQAFVEGLKAWDTMADIAADIAFPKPNILCVCVGHAAGRAGIDAHLTLTVFVQSQISNLLQVAIRLSLIGQTGAAHILASLEAQLSELVASMAETTLDDLGTSTINAEIMAMKHQYLPSRMFRS